jgi:hypothetical protein
MLTAVLGIFGKVMGGLTKHLPIIGAFFAGKKAEQAKSTKRALQEARKKEKIKLNNKKAKDDKLLKKAKKYQRNNP